MMKIRYYHQDHWMDLLLEYPESSVKGSSREDAIARMKVKISALIERLQSFDVEAELLKSEEE